MSLTARHRDLMLFLQRYQDAHGGVSPSTEEMREGLSLMSKSGVNRLLNALEERGFVRRIPRRARAIEILRRVADAYAPKLTDAGRDALRALVIEIADAPQIDPYLWRRKAQQLVAKYGLMGAEQELMRYLTRDEALALGLVPYAIYGGKVYSVLVPEMYSAAAPRCVAHGTAQYAKWVEMADATRAKT